MSVTLAAPAARGGATRDRPAARPAPLAARRHRVLSADVRRRVLVELHPDPDDRMGLAGHRAESADGLCRTRLARQRRVHVDGRVLRLQSAAARRLAAAAAGADRRRCHRRDRGRVVRPAKHPHQGLLSRRLHARRAVLLRVAVHQLSLVLQQQPDADDLRAAAGGLRPRSALRAGPLPAGVATHREPAGCSPTTSCAAASAATGWRSATWTRRRR